MKNCREFCPYQKLCEQYYPDCKGEDGLSHNDCPIAWKIEDLLMDAKEVEEVIPFCEDYYGPEVLE